MFDLRRISSNSTIIIPSGVHNVPDTIAIRGSNIKIIGEDGAELHGTIPLTRKDFTEVEPGVYCASVDRRVDGLYISGRKYTMARYPKFTDAELVYGGYAADCVSSEKTKEWSDPSGGYIHALHAHLWGGYSYRIEGKNDDHTLKLSGGWQNNRQMGMHDAFRFAENILEEMTLPGEFVYRESEQKLYLRLVPGDDPDTAEAVVNSVFFRLEDCETVTIENITFRGSARTFMETKEPLLRSDWTVCRKGCVLIQNGTGITLDKCKFLDIGSNGVFANGNARNVSVVRSHFRNIGASGVCFVGHPDSVRSPLFEYNETHTPEEIDRTPGPKSDNYPKNCLVEDCLMEYTGTTEKQSAGIQVSMAYGITIRNCTLCHMPRAGINFSEGTFGGHRIEGCDVFDTVRETGDHGSFNSWGRDRYWHLEGAEDALSKELSHLDMLDGNVITASRFRCDHGWDIDLDDGSSYFTITNNLCLNGGIKLREGFHRTVRHNICVNNTVHTHAWYDGSEDTVEENILFTPYAPYAMPQVWGKSMNRNFFHTAGQSHPTPARELQNISGQDADSVCIDCCFADPAASDYRPRNSALDCFAKFPTVFGVRYEPLRAIADTPELPVPGVTGNKLNDLRSKTVNGVTLRNILDDGEMSLYATPGHTGALITDLSPEARARGLKTEDVILSCNGKKTTGPEDLEESTDWNTCSLTFLRKQKTMNL